MPAAKLAAPRYVSLPGRPSSVARKRPSRKIGRYLALGVVCVIAFLFAYRLSSESGLFHVKEIAISGSDHYTQTEIVAALGMVNVYTLSELEIENRLKRQFSYIKQANISKSVLQRSLSIEITEREPVALLEYPKRGRPRFVLVDHEGYVLEYRDSAKSTDEIRIIADGQPPPKPGEQALSDSVQLALKVLRSAFRQTPEIANALRTIDANRPNRITLQLKNSPVVVWLSSDLIETGIYHAALFIRAALMEERQRDLKFLRGYLDARFEEAIYWGGRK
jgi:cell division septal protein FtsQ